MQGDVVVVQGIPLEIWSHNAELNLNFGTGAYKDQAVLLQGMDGHTEWANPALLKRAGITAAYLKGLSKIEQGYYGFGKDFEPNGFLVDAGKEKVDALLPQPDDAGCWRLAGRCSNTTTVSESLHGSIRSRCRTS